MRELLESGESGLALARRIAEWAGALPAGELAALDAAVHLDKVTLLPPVPNPEKIICVGRNYVAHAEEVGLDTPGEPELFAKFGNALIGHDAPIVLPEISTMVDYEAELGVVIGRRARNVTAAEALDYVAGYTIVHDVSARDLQMRTSQWLAGKALDGFAPVGPWLVTPDEIPDPQRLRLRLQIGGTTYQDASTETMVHSVAEIISYLSRLMTLVPGDLIATGTPEGVGAVRTPPRYLKDGDVVEITIESIGTLSNPVVAAAKAGA
ncbi:fumarylacetoacetate hydrolase family protein [Thermocatellispora tengchongensis]|uniref:fumarylacetoacetate hydrolase family protein n=1 Tax=Thermocatellispora tengchongensis TaxID=1073253 RepID=UPI00362F54A4